MMLTTENKQPLLKSPATINTEDYSVLTPQFPPDFYRWLTSLCPEQNCAWDVITGQGAIPVTLTEYFSRVIGTETTAEKLKTTLTYPRVEHGTLQQIKQLVKPHTVDLITLQNQWQQLDMDWFKDSLKTLAHADTALVLWRLDSPQISASLDALQHEFLDYLKETHSAKSTLNKQTDDWPEWSDHGIHFTAIKSPRCQLNRNWTLQHFIDYLGSLPEVKNIFNASGVDPRAAFIKRFTTAWGVDVSREVIWTAHCQAYKSDTL